MFEPNAQELAQAGDLLSDLLAEGRRKMRSPEGQQSRLDEQRQAAADRSAAAAARMMEKMQWRPRASVALVLHAECSSCGSTTSLFQGFGVEMYRNSDQSTRVVMGSGVDGGWERKIQHTHAKVEACPSCLPRFGFGEF